LSGRRLLREEDDRGQAEGPLERVLPETRDELVKEEKSVKEDQAVQEFLISVTLSQ